MATMPWARPEVLGPGLCSHRERIKCFDSQDGNIRNIDEAIQPARTPPCSRPKQRRACFVGGVKLQKDRCTDKIVSTRKGAVVLAVFTSAASAVAIPQVAHT